MLKSLTIQTLVNIKYPSNQNPNQWESIKFQFSEIKVEQEGPRPSQAKFNHIADQNLIKNESNSYQILLKVIKIFLNLIKNQSKFSYILYIFPDTITFRLVWNGDYEIKWKTIKSFWIS